MWWKNKEQLDWSKAGTVMAGDTLPRMFWNAVGERGDRVIFRQKSYGLWQTLTWRQLAEIVRETGMGLIELGFEPGETISILGNTRQEWLFCDLAALCAGARSSISGGVPPANRSSMW